MDRQFYLDLADAGLRMPIGTDLVLREHPDHQEIVRDGRRLGELVESAARRFRTPLAVPLMDLTVEKTALLENCGISESRSESYHFEKAPPWGAPLKPTERMLATCAGIRYISDHTDLLPVGMTIGPFSLTTKLLPDPITPVFLAGRGAANEPEVQLLRDLLQIARTLVRHYVEAQLVAGARAVIVCEPAANKVFFSPNQLAKSYDIFDEFVIGPNQEIRDTLREYDADLIFHNCGELIEGMVRRFGALDPAILSLGSSRKLWEDAMLVPKATVLYGNLPRKQFYSDGLMDVDAVRRLSRELLDRMKHTGHPFILGSECDVLSVPGHESTIMNKVDAFLTC